MPTHFTSLIRYSQWDGSQKPPLDADDILGALAEDLMEFGDLQQALRYLMQRGLDTADGNYIKGLRDLMRQLKDERRQRLERYDMGSVMEDIRQQLEEIIDMERQTIDNWASQADGSARPGQDDGSAKPGQGDGSAQRGQGDQGDGIAKPEQGDGSARPGQDDGSAKPGQGDGSAKPGQGDGVKEAAASYQVDGANSDFSDQLLGNISERNRDFIDNLPNDPAGKVKALEDYEFLNTDAQRKFLKLLDQLRKAMTQSFFKDIQKMISELSDGDLERMKNMVRDLNDMLVKKIAGEDPGFADFMEKYGDMFGDNPPKNLDELLAQIQQQMAATQALFNSMTPEQQQQLQELMQGRFGDPELESELAKLAKELDYLNPNSGQFNFSGDEDIDLLAAMELMQEMTAMDQLEQQMQRAQYDGKMDTIDADSLESILGKEAADNFEDMKALLKVLEEAGYVTEKGNKWELTPRGTRNLGQKALAEIYARLKKQGLGGHAIPEEGRFGERVDESKPWEFGDPFHLHMSRTIRNALEREGPGSPVRLKPDDFEIYRSEVVTRTATVLMVDLSWSMALRGSFQSAKKVAMALHNLISTSYPGDSLHVLGFSAYAKEIKAHDLPYLQYDDYLLGTNMQHALMLAEKLLSRHRIGTRQVIMITDGEPTAHLENGHPVFAYPPTPKTLRRTLRAVRSCTAKDIVINTFMLDQSHYLKAFVEQISKINGGRIFYAEPHNLGEYILVDYVQNKRKRLSRR